MDKGLKGLQMEICTREAMSMESLQDMDNTTGPMAAISKEIS